MARRMPKPFYRSDRKLWYVQVGGKQHNLGPDPIEAQKKYFKLMAGHEEITADSAVGVLIDQYLTSVQTLRPKSYKPHSFRLNVFWEFLQEKYGFIKISQLKAMHWTKFQEWMAVQPAKKRKGKRAKDPAPGATRFSQNTISTILCAVQTCFKWGVDNQVISKNPFEGLDRPFQTPRECLITQEQFEEVLKHVPDDNLRDVLIMFRETGARPFEIRECEASNFDRKEKRLVFSRNDSKGGKFNRVIYLNDIAFAIVAKWAMKHPEGPIFRNTKGKPWENNAIHCRLGAIAKKVGFKLMPYALRHTFATDGLANGVDVAAVAELMGHRNPTMVLKVYGHMKKLPDHLREALKKTTEKPQTEPEQKQELPPTGTEG